MPDTCFYGLRIHINDAPHHTQASTQTISRRSKEDRKKNKSKKQPSLIYQTLSTFTLRYPPHYRHHFHQRGSSRWVFTSSESSSCRLVGVREDLRQSMVYQLPMMCACWDSGRSGWLQYRDCNYQPGGLLEGVSLFI